jgi:beta-mannosidase
MMKKLTFLIVLFLTYYLSEAQSLRSIDLSGTWQVTWNEGGHGPQSLESYLQSDPVLDPPRFMDVKVPMELHLAMEEAGLVEDLNYGINTLKARWVAEKYWLYVKRFIVSDEALKQKCWLVFEQLDLNAIIKLNGETVGNHNSAFVPCRIDVTGKLQQGENLIQVGIESGLYGVAEKEGSAYNQNMGAILNKRHWMRKPQYQFLWDWNPQLINVGITGTVRLEWTGSPRLDQVVVQCRLNEDLSKATLTVKPFIESIESSENYILRIKIPETGDNKTAIINLKQGIAAYPVLIEIDNPKLWWPAGQGEQYLYKIDLELLNGEVLIARKSLRTGIRSVRIDQPAQPVEGKYFTLIVNNRRVFMKGGNWVPPEMIYSNISREKLEVLTDLAVKSNFNMLRIWGGAIWAGHDLLDLCDEKGLLIWHDLLFACSKYPADDLEFYNLVKNEVTWGVREFSPHPSLAVWCGNNENEMGTFDWGWDKFGKIMPDYVLYHHTIPVIMIEEDPSRPYWPSSPYSPGHLSPNSPIIGDQHPWNVSLGSAGADFWHYRSYVDRFPNEGGVLGASSPATLKQFLPKGEQFIRSVSWDHHDNEVNFWNMTPGLNYQLTELWIGKKAQELTFEKYTLASGLIQAEGLTEYISNYRRRMFSTSSAVFWMYNDSWPVTHGWTTVDYYLRRKLAYHPVRRAYQPVSVVVVRENDSIKVYGVNDSPDLWQGKVRYGIFNTSGGLLTDKNESVVVPSGCSKVVASIPNGGWEEQIINGGAFALLEQDGKHIAQHRLFLKRFKELKFSKPDIEITKGKGTVTFKTDRFIWGACIDTDGDKNIPDNCFDILPGIPYAIFWNEKEKPKVLFTGNDLFY